ncbi:MAG TPA: hypothetical protein VGF94_00605 [Kofleriaceae bacterium]
MRAVIDAAPHVAELARAIRDPGELLGALVLACGELVHGYAAPPDSPARRVAHHRAWSAVRQLDRGVLAARLGRRAPAGVVAKAQRAVDRADVFVGALPGVICC